eukprot:520041-Pleurochrysis_carterae.AAC.1
MRSMPPSRSSKQTQHETRPTNHTFPSPITLTRRNTHTHAPTRAGLPDAPSALERPGVTRAETRRACAACGGMYASPPESSE